MIKKISRLNMGVILLSSILLSQKVMAVDLGKRGHTFDIIEESFVAMMKRKLESVDIKKYQEEMQNIVEDKVNNPREVEGITPAKQQRIFYFDPTYELKEDAILPCGKVIHKAGTRVNPLDYMNLERRMFFIDSRDKAQVKWLVEQLDNAENIDKKDGVQIEDRVILVGGSVLKLQEEMMPEHKDKIYFDQSGEIIGRFGIKHVPAIAMQEDKQIRIQEVPLDSNEVGIYR